MERPPLCAGDFKRRKSRGDSRNRGCDAPWKGVCAHSIWCVYICLHACVVHSANPTPAFHVCMCVGTCATLLCEICCTFAHSTVYICILTICVCSCLLCDVHAYVGRVYVCLFCSVCPHM